MGEGEWVWVNGRAVSGRWWVGGRWAGKWAGEYVSVWYYLPSQSCDRRPVFGSVWRRVPEKICGEGKHEQGYIQRGLKIVILVAYSHSQKKRLFLAIISLVYS
jgi:hypothetical protein